MPKFLTLDDVDVEGKTVLLRVDLNTPIEPGTGRLLDATKFVRHTETIKELLSKGAKVVVLTHQGRRGDPDFTTLRQHAEELSKVLGGRVKYVDDVFGSRAKEAIGSLKRGEVLLLENVRVWEGEDVDRPPEEHANTPLVTELAPLADLFVNDAFATSHRSHASLVGFTAVLPSVAGRVMERELRAIEKILEEPKHPSIYLIGGAKVEDAVKICRNLLGKGVADAVLTGGVAAMLMAAAKGFDLGPSNMKLLEDMGYAELTREAEDLLLKHGDEVRIPLDFAVETLLGERLELPLQSFPQREPIMDIGSETAIVYGAEVLKAKTVVMSGPMGVYEKRRFAIGTACMFAYMVASRAYSVVGGGHTVAAAQKLNMSDKFSYVSTGGGALMALLMGEELPAVKALELAAQRA
ncbi:MAG: phosphoglycerate kinase [Candidatus Nezhaarchaeota archaeon]|nr:phosphoglycerate kinase [Candidatus Nezhaarchaeota archaeon]